MHSNNEDNFVEIDHPIVALATPRSRSALALVRITGKDCISLLEPFVTAPSQTSTPLTTWKANQVKLCSLTNPQTKEKMDEAMLTVFRAPHSFTGQDSVEISMHGSLVGIDKFLSMLYTQGFEPATPGEFTKRAFLAGKLDLTQAEAIHSLIDAHSAESHSLALQQLSGSVSSFINKIKTALMEIAATCSICLDYPDDEIQESTELDSQQISSLIDMLDQSIESYELTRIHRQGAVVILAGRTNVGKSTIFNALLKEERSIVSDIHGTTRDFIESQLALREIPLRLFDTAGLRHTTECVEQEGISRSHTLIESSDIILYTIDASEGIVQEDREQLAQIIENLLAKTSTDPLKKLMLLWNKIDISSGKVPSTIEIFLQDTSYLITDIYPISALNYQNIHSLQNEIYHKLQSSTITATQDLTVINSLRQQQHLKECRSALQHVLDGLAQDIPLDMISLDVSTALKALGNITGEVSNEEILDLMFSNFCVGK